MNFRHRYWQWREQYRTPRRILATWGAMILTVGVMGIASYRTMALVIRERKITTTLTALKTEIKHTRGEWEQTENKITEIQTAAGVEKIAKAQLNLKNSEEEVVIVSPVIVATSTPPLLPFSWWEYIKSFFLF